jgi:hypothetical protein
MGWPIGGWPIMGWPIGGSHHTRRAIGNGPGEGDIPVDPARHRANDTLTIDACGPGLRRGRLRDDFHRHGHRLTTTNA